MNIPLTEFEQHIDETILKRGLQYFKKDLVNEPEEIGTGEYEAIVEGTEPYTVQLTINNGIITKHVCSCPYDMGPVCKHVVAVIFHLLQNDLDLKVKNKKNSGRGKKNTEERKTPKKKTTSEQVDEVLEKVSHDDLKIYLNEQCAKDRSFRQLFFANFAYLVIPDSRELYAKQIQALLKAATGRLGYIEYSESHSVGGAVYEMVERARQFVESSNYLTAIYIACAVIEEMSKALEYVDDSSGDFSGCVESSIEVLNTLAEKYPPEDVRIELLNYCLKSFKSEIFKSYDWHFSMLGIAILLVKTAEEIKYMHELIDRVKPSGKDWDWNYDEARRIKLNLIRNTEDEDKVTSFLEQNINIGNFRKELIEVAISKKEYQKAIFLAEDGITQDDKSKPGLADEWRNYLLMVYINLNDTENIIKLARYLFLNGRRELNTYFTLLKKHVKPDEWRDFVIQLVKNISGRDRYIDYSLIAKIYIWEECWDRLFEVVKKNVSLNWLDTYDQYLVRDYADEISDLYQKALLDFMVINLGRGHYQTVCRYLRKMIKMGARDKANNVIQQLKALYPKRKALMEELQKVYS
jgi:hypothetical protein